MPESFLTRPDGAEAAEGADRPDGAGGSPAEAARALGEQLADEGVRVVAGWSTNASNLVHAKTMPVARTADFVTSGAGMSPVHHGYSLDGSIQFTPYISAIGDLRLRLVPEAVRLVGDGVAMGPTMVYTQDGELDPSGPRFLLDQAAGRCRAAGLEPTVGYELEFTLVQPDGSPLEAPVWTPYGLSAVLDRESFFVDLARAAERAGVGIQQTHAEFGHCQMEVSLPPATPLEAADTMIVTKALVGRVARDHGLMASFSPVPFVGSVGNGSHQHFSLTRDGSCVFAGGEGPHGITAEGGHAIAGVIDGLHEIQALLTGSVLSGARVTPGLWSGAYNAWGTENRETALRFLAGGPSNPYGANIEVKVIDPSANPYASAAAVLGLMLDGIDRGLPLPEEATELPADLDDAERERRGYRLLFSDQAAMLDALETGRARDLLGEPFVLATLAVRRHEAELYGALDPAQAAERLRLTWTV